MVSLLIGIKPKDSRVLIGGYCEFNSWAKGGQKSYASLLKRIVGEYINIKH